MIDKSCLCSLVQTNVLISRQRISGKHELKAPLGDVAEPSYAFQVAHCDIVGPFPLSNRGNRYMLTFVDKLTKQAEAIPLADVSAVT
jgi:hypothetical protein